MRSMILFNMYKFYNKKTANLESIGKQKPLKSRSDKYVINHRILYGITKQTKTVCIMHASKERLEI